MYMTPGMWSKHDRKAGVNIGFDSLGQHSVDVYSLILHHWKRATAGDSFDCAVVAECCISSH